MLSIILHFNAWANVHFFYKAYLIKSPTYLISVEVPSLHMFVKP